MTQAGKPPLASRLAIRFGVILTLALLPAGIIGFVQTSNLEAEVQRRSETALMGAALRAASSETVLITRVRGMVATLAAAVPDLIADNEACSAFMQQLIATEPRASLAAYIPTSGVMTCSSSGRVHDFSDSPRFQTVIEAKAPFLVVSPDAAISGTSVLGISHPVFDGNGTYIGYATMSLPHNMLQQLATADDNKLQDSDGPLVFFTFDKAGTLLTSNIDLDAAKLELPDEGSIEQFVGTAGGTFRGRSVNGRAMTYAVVPVEPNELYLMSSFLPNAEAISWRSSLSPYLPTLLMWLVGLMASGVATEILVTRHIRTLNRSMGSFARGDRRLDEIELTNAPRELEELATAYLAMTEGITRGEAELEDSLHQKEVLLREVHHRVKNNLQLISSIMNIQIRSAKSGEAKELLKNLQERIMSLATVHRGLYQTSGLADVRARELIPDIVRQIMSLSSNPEKPFETVNDIDDLRIVPDQAVPLSLLLAEALTNAIKHAGATRDRPGHLSVRLKRSGGSGAVLEVINTQHDMADGAQPAVVAETGIGSQLIMAFVQQLNGALFTGNEGENFVLRVTFNVAPLSHGENRQKPSEASEARWNAPSA